VITVIQVAMCAGTYLLLRALFPEVPPWSVLCIWFISWLVGGIAATLPEIRKAIRTARDEVAADQIRNALRNQRGCTAAELLSVLVLVALVSLAALSYGAEPGHECGHGPVTIELSLGQCCACAQPTPTLKRIAGNRYASDGFVTTDAVCCPCGFRSATWTDWPECGGRESPIVLVELHEARAPAPQLTPNCTPNCTEPELAAPYLGDDDALAGDMPVPSPSPTLTPTKGNSDCSWRYETSKPSGLPMRWRPTACGRSPAVRALRHVRKALVALRSGSEPIAFQRLLEAEDALATSAERAN
jgi:hypothetical protein